MSNIKDFFGGGGGGVATGTLVEIPGDGVDYLPQDSSAYLRADFPELTEIIDKYQLRDPTLYSVLTSAGLTTKARGAVLNSGRYIIPSSPSASDTIKSWVSDDYGVTWNPGGSNGDSNPWNTVVTNGVDAFLVYNKTICYIQDGSTWYVPVTLSLDTKIACMTWDDDGIIFAGDTHLAIQDTPGDMAHWTEVAPSGIDTGQDITSISRRGDLVIITDTSNKMRTSSDAGMSFTLVDFGGLLTFQCVKSDDGTKIYVSTNAGVYSTTDGIHFIYEFKVPGGNTYILPNVNNGICFSYTLEYLLDDDPVSGYKWLNGHFTQFRDTLLNGTKTDILGYNRISPPYVGDYDTYFCATVKYVAKPIDSLIKSIKT